MTSKSVDGTANVTQSTVEDYRSSAKSHHVSPRLGFGVTLQIYQGLRNKSRKDALASGERFHLERVKHLGLMGLS